MKMKASVQFVLAVSWAAVLAGMLAVRVHATSVRRYDFMVKYTNVTRLCHTKQLVSVNDMFPGPVIKVTEGDKVRVKVTNTVSYNMTIHWHGVNQVRSAWADGPAYVTQCPIQQGKSYTYRFTVVQQRGTLFWHAHISWQRATVHGAFLIYPKLPASYPFPKPAGEFTLVLGEWWNADVEAIINAALAAGTAYNISNALTVNGQPGALYNCSLADTTVLRVRRGETYLLRFINAAMNFQMYVAVPNHTLTVVAADADYTASLERDVIVLAPGQTTDVLIRTDQPIDNYFLAASVFSPPLFQFVPFPTAPATAVLRYEGAGKLSGSKLPALPAFPLFNDTSFVANYTKSLRNYQSVAPVPTTIDEHLVLTFNYATQPCATCTFNVPDTRLSASINNITFVEPEVSILEAYFKKISGVYQSDFPSVPAIHYNYTGVNLAFNGSTSILGTRVKELEYGATVQLVFQDTHTVQFDGHPIHLHGQSVYVVAEGFGNFNPDIDTPNFNLKNPPSRNTVAVPSGGWAVVRFRAVNPGVWFLHCHFDLHASWGMDMAFITKHGKGGRESLPPPPPDFPKC